MCSPFHRHAFLSVGVDGTLCFRSILQRLPLMSASRISDNADRGCLPTGLYCADWSKFRPLVFAVAGDGGIVRIHDLGTAQPMIPVAELETPPSKAAAINCVTRNRILAIQFNPKQRDFLACGDSAGQVHIWKLSWSLANARTRERQHLQACVVRHQEANV